MVELALQKAQNNQTQAARLLDISRDALRYKMKKFGLMGGEEDKSAERPTKEEDEPASSPHF
jgi:DNA-binding NtrC family response regulator